MQITIVQGAFLPVPPVAGGAVEKLWFDLGREFARRGLGVTHISRHWPGLPERHETDGVDYLRVTGFNRPPSRPLGMLMDLVYSLRCLVKLKRSDIVVTNTFFLPLLLTALRAFGWRATVYVSVHRYPQGQMRYYGKVARLQCVSTAVADAVREQAPYVGKLVKVVPNYVSGCRESDDTARTWSARRREILFVGRVHPEKGVESLIRAFARIDPALRAGWTLRVVGPHEAPAGGGGEPFLLSLKQTATELGVPVEWTGPIYDSVELNEAYRSARLFVYPTTAAKGEAFPLAPLEAMGQGCPAVTSDLRCFADFIVPGENAACFPVGVPADIPAALSTVLSTLMADEEHCKRLSANGLRTARQFTLKKVADVFVDDFVSLSAA